MSVLTRLRAWSLERLKKSSIERLIRIACWVALVGLAVIVASILDPAPLPVIFAMSVGQVIGIAAFLCYLLSILMDVVRGPEHAPNAPGPARKFSANDPADSTTPTNSP